MNTRRALPPSSSPPPQRAPAGRGEVGTGTDPATRPAADPRRALGERGETAAADHLTARGYRIVARNVRADGVEIDLVAERRGVVAFVEVKTRTSTRFGAPEEAVDRAKQARLVRGARAWLATHPSRRPRRPRFDVIAILALPSGTLKVRHLEGAFDAS